MKVAFLTRYGRERGSSRLRAFDLVPHLEQRGVEARLLPRRRPDGRRRRFYLLRALALARWADVVVLQKPNQAPPVVDLLRAINPALTVDLDDAIWSPIQKSPSKEARLAAERAERRLLHALRRSRLSVVGSRFLANWISDRLPQLPIAVVPTCVDIDRYPLPEHSRRSRLALGWIGSGGNLSEVESLSNVLLRLASVVDFDLLVISSQSPSLPPDLPFEFIRWSEKTEIEALKRLDVGLMPLEDIDRSRGRCGFKAIQYMATGLPVVASAVGAAPEVVDDGVTGWLADSPEAWLRHLSRLARDPALRRRMGAAGRLRAERLYSLQGNLPGLIDGLATVRTGARREPT